jgi:hypothetical protein
MRHTTRLDSCFVVTKARRQPEVLYVSLDLDRDRAFRRARSFVLQYNRMSRTGSAVIRPSQAELEWNDDQITAIADS